LKILAEEGQTLPVGTVIAKLFKKGEEANSQKPAGKKETAGNGGMRNAETVVIGGGPGGYVAALKLAQMGVKTVLVERDKVGGTCLNRGCIPTKALLMSAEVVQTVRDAARMGVAVGDVKIDLSMMNSRKDQVVGMLVSGVEHLLKKRGVETIAGTASFTGPKTLRVDLAGGGVKEISAKNIIIASGSESAKIPIGGIDGKNVITSTEALDISNLPESLAVIGGGVIGMEIGSIYADLGAKVTVLEALPRILPGMDEEISRALHGIAQEKMDIYTQAKVSGIGDHAGRKKVSYTRDGEEKEVLADQVLVCVGRTPNTRALNLEAAGIESERGRICVDGGFKTNVDGVYAIGDVNGKVLLAHAASAQGIFVAETIAGRRPEMDVKTVPNCIYTKPEIASVGLTEEEAKKQKKDIKVSAFPFKANGKALAMGEPEGFVKIVADSKYGEVLGVHMIGPRATDMIAEAVLAIRMECTAAELAGTIHAHPTLSEAVMEAAEGILGSPIHIG
jgi:dihydrolipoamide dehydrogenase